MVRSIEKWNDLMWFNMTTFLPFSLPHEMILAFLLLCLHALKSIAGQIMYLKKKMERKMWSTQYPVFISWLEVFNARLRSKKKAIGCKVWYEFHFNWWTFILFIFLKKSHTLFSFYVQIKPQDRQKNRIRSTNKSHTPKSITDKLLEWPIESI